jgi:hypothetical protein
MWRGEVFAARKTVSEADQLNKKRMPRNGERQLR